MHIESFIISTVIAPNSYVEHVQSYDWVELPDDMDRVMVGDVEYGPGQPRSQPRSQSSEVRIHLGHHSAAKAGNISARH